MRLILMLSALTLLLPGAARQAHGQERVVTMRQSGMNVQIRLFVVKFDGDMACRAPQLAAIEGRARVYARQRVTASAADIKAKAPQLRQQGFDLNDPKNFLRVDGGFACSDEGTLLLRFPANRRPYELHSLRRGQKTWSVRRD